jgi:hypothetical protein
VHTLDLFIAQLTKEAARAAGILQQKSCIRFQSTLAESSWRPRQVLANNRRLARPRPMASRAICQIPPIRHLHNNRFTVLTAL